MMDIIVLEIIIALLLLVSLLRPYVKGLWPVDGIIFLPLLASVISAGIFIAYGFRPECIPLGVFSVVVCICHIPAALSFINRLRNDAFKDRHIALGAAGLLFLGAALWIALGFAPERSDDFSMEGIIQVSESNGGKEYFLRIYNPPGIGGRELQPLVFLVPPLAGSLQSMDSICRSLAESGFVVLSYSRKDLDAPAAGKDGKRLHTSFFEYLAVFRVDRRGFESGKPAAKGKALEEERMRDIRFLLSYITENAGRADTALAHADPGLVIAAGFDMGGSAMTMLASQPDFHYSYPQLAGFINIEGPLLSSLVLEPLPEYRAAGKNPLGGLWAGLRNFIAQWKPVRITGTELETFPRIPALYIVSDAIREASARDGRYSSIIKLLHGSESPAMLAAIPGGSSIDYAGIPALYPLIGLVFNGPRAEKKSPDYYPEGAAALICNFSVSITEMKRAREQDPSVDSFPVRRQEISGDLYTESGALALPNFP